MLIVASVLAWLVVGLGVAVFFGLMAQMNRQPEPQPQETARKAALARGGSPRRMRVDPRATRFRLSPPR
jgi:hypothetical protein